MRLQLLKTAVPAADSEGARGPYSPLDQRILSYYPEIRAIRRGEIPRPRMAIVYPVYGCNLDCLGCEYGDDNAQGFVMLDHDRFLSLIDELHAMGVEGVEFCGGGEPSLHPALIDAVLRGAGYGMRFGMLSNGTAFNDRFFAEALPHFSYLRLTIDAADEAMYQRVRPSHGRSPWPRLLANIRRLVHERAARGLGFDLSLKYLVSRENEAQIEDAVARARDLGVDSIQFKALRLHPAELRPDEAATVMARLHDVRRAAAPFPVLGGVDKLTMRRPCELTPLQVTIDAMGDVFLCCYFRHRRQAHSIGNIYQTPLPRLWGTSYHRQAIAGIDPQACSVLDCRFVRYHEIVDRVIGDEPGGFSFI